MITGSFASSFHGVPRTTHDIDVIVVLTGSNLDRLIGLLPNEDYYVSAEAARDALLRRGQFNVIDLATGWKADLIVRKDRPFSQNEFQKETAGCTIPVGAKEQHSEHMTERCGARPSHTQRARSVWFSRTVHTSDALTWHCGVTGPHLRSACSRAHEKSSSHGSVEPMSRRIRSISQEHSFHVVDRDGC